jgi:hypothetical protein
MCIYVRQLELLLKVWKDGDHSRLQPTIPSHANVFQILLNMLKKKASDREMELIGVSSAQGAVTVLELVRDKFNDTMS